MFALISCLISFVASQSCCQCNTFRPSIVPACQPCAQCQPFQIPAVPSTPCQIIPPPAPACQLPPPPVTESSNDNLRYHSDSANRQGCQDTMRANAQTGAQNSLNDERCAAQNAKMKFDADVKSQNNKFREVNENEFLVHKKNAREECGDSSQRSANIDLDASNGCRAAQSHNDDYRNSMCAGRDRSSRAEDCAQTNIDGLRSSYSMRPRGCGACFF